MGAWPFGDAGAAGTIRQRLQGMENGEFADYSEAVQIGANQAINETV